MLKQSKNYRMSNSQKNNLISEAPAWRALSELSKLAGDISIVDLFKGDQKRAEKLQIGDNGVFFDFSKHLVSDEILTALLDLLPAADFENKRAALFAGDPINMSEDRPVLHTALRGTQTSKDGVSEFVRGTLDQMQKVSAAIRADTAIKNVLHIGIGGSNVGPSLAIEALDGVADGPRIHFISNIDGQHLDSVLAQCSPDNTAAIIASKTFSTQETMANASTVKDWLNNNDRLFAVTEQKDAASAFGISSDHILPMREWIGGRYSIWGAIGLPVAIATGYENFEAFLSGAADADKHFQNAPVDKNIPIIMAVLGVWYRNFIDLHAHAVLPYAQGLAKFPLYLQQIDMESNGKSVGNDGTFVDYKTSPIVFGEAGTDAQHTFMQCLHQGTDVIPADFIMFKTAAHDHQEHHNILNANALAQSKTLMEGQENTDEPHRNFSGNRPSSTLILDQQDPYHLGLLMALYEHKIFVQGAIWGINSFDQWGVELGKTNTKTILKALKGKDTAIKTDTSTHALLNHLCDHKDKNL